MIIYVTKALQESMKIKETDIDRCVIQDEKYCWHAHIVKLNGKNTIILMNDKTTYAILLRNKLPRSLDKFKELVKKSICEGLMMTNLDFYDYFRDMGDVIISRNHDRQMLGNINEAVYEASFAWDLWSDTETLQVESMMRVNSGVRKKGKQSVIPEYDVIQLLEK